MKWVYSYSWQLGWLSLSWHSTQGRVTPMTGDLLLLLGIIAAVMVAFCWPDDKNKK